MKQQTKELLERTLALCDRIAQDVGDEAGKYPTYQSHAEELGRDVRFHLNREVVADAETHAAAHDQAPEPE